MQNFGRWQYANSMMNPNMMNPNMTSPNMTSPNMTNPNMMNPNMMTPNMTNPNMMNPNMMNPNMTSPNMTSPNMTSPNMMNPNMMNPNMTSPNMTNPNMTSPNMTNPNMMNPNMTNPNMMNPDMMAPYMNNPGMNSPGMMGQDMMNMKAYHNPDMTEALELVKQAVQGETEDRLFYEYLIKNAPSPMDKEIITGIRDNEITHAKLFREIYYEHTGKVIGPPKDVEFEVPKTYCDGLKRALIGETNAVIKYRKILAAMQDRRHINMLTEIITDELRHASLYNFLIHNNECKY